MEQFNIAELSSVGVKTKSILVLVVVKLLVGDKTEIMGGIVLPMVKKSVSDSFVFDDESFAMIRIL